MPKAGDTMSHLRVGRGAGPREALAFEDTEPEFDLVEPRRMERQEGQAHPPSLSVDPGGDGRVGMNGEVVRDDDEPPSGPSTAKRLQQLQELLVSAAPTDETWHSWWISARKSCAEKIRSAIVDDDWGAYQARIYEAGARYAQAGLSFGTWFGAGRALRVTIIPMIVDALRSDPERLGEAVRGAAIFVDVAMVTIGGAYLEAKERIIRTQEEAIRELSTPVLEPRPGLLLLPLQVARLLADAVQLPARPAVLGVVAAHGAGQRRADREGRGRQADQQGEDLAEAHFRSLAPRCRCRKFPGVVHCGRRTDP